VRQKEFLFDPEDNMKVMPEKLRPVSRLGGITYGRSTQYVYSLHQSQHRELTW
jgi:hypothetical protein